MHANTRRVKCLALRAAVPSLCLLAPTAFATSYTWTNSGNDSLWSNSLNWSPNGVPSTTTDTALINISSGSIAASNTVFYNYTGANVTLSQLTVTHAASRFGNVSVLSIGANALNVNNENIGDSTNGGPLAGEIDQSGNSTNYIYNTLTFGRNSNDTGYYNLSGNATLQAVNENFGVSGHAVFTQTGGQHTVNGSGNNGLFMAVNPAAVANYTLQGGGLGSYGSMYIGYGGNATVTQTAGSLGVSNFAATNPNLYLGYFAGSNGNYSMSGMFSTLAVDDTIYVGYNGNGTINQDAGNVEPTLFVQTVPALTLAFGSTATGSYTLSGGGTMDLGAVTIGQAGSGTFNHISGEVYATSVVLASAAGSHGTYVLNDGFLSDSSGMVIGEHGAANFTQSGGTVTLGPQGALYLGDSADGSGTYNLSNGSLYVNDFFFVGNAGVGTFNQSGGSVYGSHETVLEIPSKSSYSLSNGTLTLPQINLGGSFTCTGGSISPTAFFCGGTAYFHNVNTKFTVLSISGSTNNWTGSLDVTNTKIIVEPTVSRSAFLANLINQALYGRTHNTGIIDSLLPVGMAVAVIDNGTLAAPLTTFGGIAVDPNSILISQELLGDANIDGRIDLTDLALVLNNFGQSNANWTAGNFDGAATIDAADLTMVLNNFGRTNPNAATAQVSMTTSPLPASAPEPASLALLLPAAISLYRRRRLSIA